MIIKKWNGGEADEKDWFTEDRAERKRNESKKKLLTGCKLILITVYTAYTVYTSYFVCLLLYILITVYTCYRVLITMYLLMYTYYYIYKY